MAQHSGAASGGQLEEKVDLSAEVAAKLAQAEALVDASSIQEALTLLAGTEKKCRVGNDAPSLIRVCEASIRHAAAATDDLQVLVNTLVTLSTRRSQKSAAIQAMVQLCLPWVTDGKNAPIFTKYQREDCMTLIVTLRDISDGKIYLEAERARLTRALAALKEQSGDIDGAANVLQEVHVETYGSISKKEKVEFILEQMRLTLAKKDFVRAHIVANKISRKNLQQEDMQDYKVSFFTLMTVYHMHEKDALELAKDYHAIYSTPSVLADDTKWHDALQKTVIYLALAPFSNEQQDLMHKLSRDSNLESLPASQATIALFLKQEIIAYPMAHQAELEPLLEPSSADYWKALFHRRVLQHSIRVVSKYYKRIHGSRLATLLGLDTPRLELEISDMVSQGDLYAKMDRPLDIIRFSRAQSPESVLTNWAADIDQLLGLVEKTTHLIQKENMTA